MPTRMSFLALYSTAVVVVASVVFALPLLAQPDPSSYSGEWVDGTQVTISGARFGTKVQAEPVIWDRLDNIPAYDNLADGAEAPVRVDGCDDCPWYDHIPTSWGNPPRINRNESDLRVPGRPVYSVGRKGFFRGEDFGLTGAADLYLNWWVYTSHSLDDQGLGEVYNKVARLWPDESGTQGRSSWETDFVYYYDSDLETHTNNFSEAITPGSWHNLQAIIRSDEDMTDGGGWLEFIVDNTLRTTPESDAILSDLGSHNGPYDTVWLIGSDPHIQSRYHSNMEFHFGDIYVDTSLSRVLIGDASTYSSCTHLEIQPATAWTETSITVDVNLGGMTRGDTWLYVFDGDNTVNEAGLYIGATAPGQPGQPVIVNND